MFTTFQCKKAILLFTPIYSSVISASTSWFCIQHENCSIVMWACEARWDMHLWYWAMQINLTWLDLTNRPLGVRDISLFIDLIDLSIAPRFVSPTFVFIPSLCYCLLSKFQVAGRGGEERYYCWLPCVAFSSLAYFSQRQIHRFK